VSIRVGKKSAYTEKHGHVPSWQVHRFSRANIEWS